MITHLASLFFQFKVAVDFAMKPFFMILVINSVIHKKMYINL